MQRHIARHGDAIAQVAQTGGAAGRRRAEGSLGLHQGGEGAAQGVIQALLRLRTAPPPFRIEGQQAAAMAQHPGQGLAGGRGRLALAGLDHGRMRLSIHWPGPLIDQRRHLPLLGLFLTIPGGGLTDLGDKQQTMAELLITAAMAPSMGATMLGVIALWRAWRMG